jgi:ribonuclease III
VKLILWILRLKNRYFASEEDRALARRVREIVGFTPAKMNIFRLAFAHKSTPSEKDYAMQNNERLEFLGDAVLGTIVAEYLFQKYPREDEGFLTKMRSKIVKRKSLNEIGKNMGLDTLLDDLNPTRITKSMHEIGRASCRERV